MKLAETAIENSIVKRVIYSIVGDCFSEIQ